MTTVRELFTRMGFKVDNASLNRVDGQVNRVKDSAEKMAGAIRNAALAFGGFQAVQGLVRIADEAQSIRARLEALPQTIGDVNAAFDTVADRAAAAGLSLEAYAGLYTRVGNAAKSYITTQEDLLGVTDTISKALVVGGASAQEASAVMQQFAQALASGVLQGDEFRSMAEAAPQYLDQLSIAMGIPREQLKKMASDGKLTAREVIEATRKMSGFFEDRFKKMPMTVGRAINVVSVRFAKMIDKMNRETDLIPMIADKIVKAFDKVEEVVGIVIDKLGGFENAVRLAGAAIVAAFGAKAISVLAAFRTASLLALWPYIRMAIILTAVTLALEDLYTWIQGGESVIGAAIGPWTDYAGTVQDAWDKVKEFGPALQDLAKFIGISTAAFVAMEIALKVARGAMILWQGVVILATALQWAWNAAMSANPIGLIIIGIAALVAAGVWLVANWQSVKDWFMGLFDWMAEKFGWLADKIRGLGKIAALIPGLNVVAGGIAAYDAMQPGPGKMSSQGQGKGNVANVNTTVNMTVPPGTTKEQQAAINRTAQTAFGKPSNALARDLSARGR